jgi:hypothetical protein
MNAPMETCAQCGQAYEVENSDARTASVYCSRDCERENHEDHDADEDTGRYCGGYRVYRGGYYREDFGGDR